MNNWRKQQNLDFFIKKRKEENKISRAYYKIKEINEKFGLLNNSKTVLDLGAAPGGWSQYFSEQQKKVLAIDILPEFKMKNIKFVQGDIFDKKLFDNLERFDLICSDMAPNLSGNSLVDNGKCLDLWEQCFRITKKHLKLGKNFTMKVFESEELVGFAKEVRPYFKMLKYFKPKSSRPESKEIFLVALKFTPPRT